MCHICSWLPVSKRVRKIVKSYYQLCNVQRCKQPTSYNNFRLLIFLLVYLNLLYVFRATNSPIFSSTFDCIYSFGIMHRYCCRPVTRLRWNWYPQNTYYIQYGFFFRKSSSLGDNAENFVEPGRPQTAIWRMRIAFWVPKSTITRSEYVMLIVFTLQ